ncbi:MAG: 1-acyl-sn-glycerol-3-phosphate acyltransferase [Burkholderiales bacterium]|nr:1-acyl-sn-glycerol-3-phosphate acyltransferase [Burkholderiales bacterium]
MDLRGFESTRRGGRLTRAARPPVPELRRRLLFALVIAQLGLVSLVWNLLAPLLSLLLPRRTRERIGRAAISFIYRSGWATAERLGMMSVDSSALDALRDEPGGLIVAANHPAMFDAMVVVARLPRGACVMKAELLRNVFLGGGARLAGYIRNDSGRGMVRAAVECLKEGGQLVLFPEGTRTVRPPVNAFKPGITMIAHLAKAPIQTVIIESDSPYLRKGWPLLRPPPAPVVIRVRLGKRFEPQADHRNLLRAVERYFALEIGG